MRSSYKSDIRSIFVTPEDKAFVTVMMLSEAYSEDKIYRKTSKATIISKSRYTNAKRSI